MLHHRVSQDPIHMSQLEAVSRDRPPQWKWSNCGYRCGLGCEEPSDEDGEGSRSEDDETARTLVNSENVMRATRIPLATHGDNESFNNDQTFQDARPSFPINSNDERVGVLLPENDSENEHIDQQNPTNNQSDFMDSLAAESRATDDQSMMRSMSEGVEITSPGPGIGSWMENEPYRGRLPTEYHFLRTPLRLSPQYEHCRGSPVGHDALLFLERWNEY